MGTSLAFSAGHLLAGQLQNYLRGDETDLSSALARYNKQMRPIVDNAQKLIPGQQYIMAPETAWRILLLRLFGLIVSYAKFFIIILGTVFHLGPQRANNVEVADFGFKDMPAWNEDSEQKE
jgi:hypothetical protein